MRDYFDLDEGWEFSKEAPKDFNEFPEESIVVNVPHTWNKYDGQGGYGDYERGTFYYTKEIPAFERRKDSRVYLEFKGANSSANVYVNGKKAGRHEGGYSTFRFDITDLLNPGMEDNMLVVEVDNSKNHIYPQSADFTFYGGLYRDVDMIVVPETHFDLDYYGGPGIAITSKINGEDADVTVHAYVTNPKEANRVQVQILDAEGNVVAERTEPAKEDTEIRLEIKDVHLWNGVKDPYLYNVQVSLMENNETIDEVESNLGVREFYIDPQKGFFLNGVLTPLRGVSRHQDRLGKGNALDYEDHVEDIELIRELGANTMRLAHYQQAEEFYDLADKTGMIVWAEIPFISMMTPGKEAKENAEEQMKELIIQNYNHPSIVTWGISNEITIGGETEELNNNLRELNDLVHEMDPTRLTTMAQVSMLPKTSKQNQLTDVLSYNHYFGWYGGDMKDNDVWFDTFHKEYPDRALGISEYGCEGIITYHTDEPKRGDYSEEYQALYHEHMAKLINDRPWLWATHIWNMFDFGVAARDEGGVQGRNNKGLVTFDRKTKKDSFYIYQAYWTDEPMIHITSKRYAKRTADAIDVKVYTNIDTPLTLYVDGKEIASETAKDHIVIFKDVKLHDGDNMIEVKGSGIADTAVFEKVEKPEESYVFVDDSGAGVTNWFDEINVDEVDPVTDINPEYYSLNDTFNTLLENEEATQILANAFSSLSNMNVKPTMLKIFGDKTMADLGDMFAMGKAEGLSDEQKADMAKKLNYTNSQLQKIKK